MKRDFISYILVFIVGIGIGVGNFALFNFLEPKNRPPCLQPVNAGERWIQIEYDFHNDPVVCREQVIQKIKGGVVWWHETSYYKEKRDDESLRSSSVQDFLNDSRRATPGEHCPEAANDAWNVCIHETK